MSVTRSTFCLSQHRFLFILRFLDFSFYGQPRLSMLFSSILFLFFYFYLFVLSSFSFFFYVCYFLFSLLVTPQHYFHPFIFIYLCIYLVIHLCIYVLSACYLYLPCLPSPFLQTCFTFSSQPHLLQWYSSSFASRPPTTFSCNCCYFSGFPSLFLMSDIPRTILCHAFAFLCNYLSFTIIVPPKPFVSHSSD